jgi:hypothetical protein
MRGHDNPQTSLRSSNNSISLLDHSGLDGATEAEFEEEMPRLGDEEPERMEVDLDKPALVTEEEVLRHETFMNAGISPSNSRLTLGLAIEDSLDLGQSEESSVSEKTYWPFKNKDQWQLALWALFPTPISRPRAERAIVAKFAVWAKPGSCFESWGEFQRLIQNVEEKGGKWHRKVLHRVDRDPSWYPVQVRFWERNSLDILKELVADIKVAEHMKWAPEKVYNSKGERLYSELWTGDWWWRKQVSLTNVEANFRKRSTASSRQTVVMVRPRPLSQLS